MTTTSRRSFLALGASALACSRLPGAQLLAPADLTWTCVDDWRIEGRAFANRKSPYDRLPAEAEGVVRKAVWNLSRDSAGMAVRFFSSTPEVHVRYRLTDGQLDMVHMPATGVSGADLYARAPNGKMQWVQVARPKSRDVTAKLTDSMPANPDGKPHEWLLYLPLYNGVETLEIGVPAGNTIEPAPPPPGKPVLVYGTSIVHGACASRPGMAWPAIMGRTLERETINLGFSGNGRMETEVGRFLCELDPAVFVVDCLPNMSAKLVEERTVPLVRQLREARPDTPILLVEDRTFTNAWANPGRLASHQQRRAKLNESFAKLKESGVTNLHLLSADGLLGNDHEGATDGSHPNDLGMYRQANKVADRVWPLLVD
ncbi:MAG: SGNH/GDSL hydrolase family protein [Planctomycetota bacterium]|nr:SGNH/GDSL hydrolase family protein [Planctomycetota bacterium]